MPELVTIFWSVVWHSAPVLAALLAGVWLRRRGDRLAAWGFWVWAVGRVTVWAVRYYLISDWLQRPGRTANQIHKIPVLIVAAENALTAAVLGYLTLLVVRRARASDEV